MTKCALPPSAFASASIKTNNAIWSFLAIAGILIIGTLLRFRGIHWGIPTPDLPFEPFHPDEIWGMSVLSEIDFSQGAFNPVSSHREGALAYYLWYFACSLLYFFGVIAKTSSVVRVGDVDYITVLKTYRYVVASLDVGSIFLIFVIIKRLFGRVGPALVGSLIFALTPFELIHAHYMRTHVPANFFALLAFGSRH